MKIVDPDPALVAAVTRLDEAAVTVFLRQYDGIIRASVLQGGYFISDARDEEQLQNDVRKAVIEGIPTWKPNKGRFSTWVYSIARNIVNTFLRDRTTGLESGRYGEEVRPGDLPLGQYGQSVEADPEDEIVEIDPFDPPDDLAIQSGAQGHQLSPLLKAFFAVSDELSSADRVVLEHVLNGAPHRELAESEGISEDAAKVRVSRLKQRLRTLILKKVETTRP